MPDVVRPSPLPLLLLLLSLTTGLVDAASVLGLGKVFTANMTGNIVFLGFALAGAPGFVVAPGLMALVTFMAGALVAGRLGRSMGGRPLRRWLLTAAFFEVALLWGAAAIALCFDVADQAPQWALYAIIAATAIAMGFRNATIRQLKVPDLTTTVLTLTITGIAGLAASRRSSAVQRWARFWLFEPDRWSCRSYSPALSCSSAQHFARFIRARSSRRNPKGARPAKAKGQGRDG